MTSRLSPFEPVLIGGRDPYRQTLFVPGEEGDRAAGGGQLPQLHLRLTDLRGWMRRVEFRPEILARG